MPSTPLLVVNPSVVVNGASTLPQSSINSPKIKPSSHPEVKKQILNRPQQLKGCRILVAEDGIDNQRLARRILSNAGAEVTVVENGSLAADAALSADAANRIFDVVLMDMDMPVMNGYVATTLLRRCGYRGTIIAFTTNAMACDRLKCIDAGCDDYATKPIDHQGLVQLISRFLPQSQPEA